MKEKISILMTVFNCSNYLKDSIESILNQTYSNYELVIINDHSTDNSLEIIKSFNDSRLKLFNLESRYGRTKALNFGLSKCSSNFIAIQDADDLSFSKRLEILISKILENKSIGLVFSNFEIINKDGKVIRQANPDYLLNKKKFFSKLKYKNMIAHSSIIFRNKIINQKFKYNEEYIYAQDYNMILHYLKNSKINFVNKNLVKIRHHSENMTNSNKLKKIRILESLRLLNYSENKFQNDLSEKLLIKYFKIKNFIKLFFC